MISPHPWRAGLKRSRAACVSAWASGNSRRILQTHCAPPFILYSTGVSGCILGFFVKNIMALSSVGLYFAIQIEVKAVEVQWLRSTPKLQQFKMLASISAEIEASNPLRHWSQSRIELEQMLRTDHQGHTSRSYVWWTVPKIEGLQKTNPVQSFHFHF